MTTYPGSIVRTRTVSDPAYTLAPADNGQAIFCDNTAGCAVTVPPKLFPFSVAIFGLPSGSPPHLVLGAGIARISTPPNLNACNGVGPMVVTFMNATLIAVSGNATP